MANLTFTVQSLSSAGVDRVSVNLSQVNPDPAQPFYGSNLALNLSQEDASAYNVNTEYNLVLTAVNAVPAAAAPAAE